MSGVFLRDIDLFLRDITQLLNSRIGPVYNLVKQLARQLPAFFNDIGAEGRLREISTRIDELCQRRDRLVHSGKPAKEVTWSYMLRLRFMNSDCLGLKLRLEAILNAFFESLIRCGMLSRGYCLAGEDGGVLADRPLIKAIFYQIHDLLR